MIIRPSARRAAIDRWITSLTPFFDVIALRIKLLGLGEPRLHVGPTFIAADLHKESKIRRGAVWFIDGQNTGFHVDFSSSGTSIEAWTCGGERRVSIWNHGKTTQKSLMRDLKTALTAAGINDSVPTTEDVSEILRSAGKKTQV